MHNFLTSVYHEGDVRSVLIRAIQALHYTRRGIDIVSKTPVSFPYIHIVLVTFKITLKHNVNRSKVIYYLINNVFKSDFKLPCWLPYLTTMF